MDLHLTRGYLGIGIRDGGWMASMLDFVTGGKTGLTLPAGFGSVVVINEDKAGKYLPTIVKHEEVHVIQQRTLGPFFPPLYGLGHLLYGYDNNPLEVQAKKHQQ